MVGAWWLLADLMSQVLVGDHGRVDGVVFGKQLAMAAVRLSSVPCRGEGECLSGETLARHGPATVTSLTVIPFLKGLL
jgi:hypothetical protein